MIAPDAVVNAARALVGTPYAHQGRVAGRAVDCIGVAVVLGRQLGLCAPDFDILGYGRDPHDGTLLRLLDGALARLDVPCAGSLFVMQWFCNAEPQHCGILGTDARDGALTMIHAHGGEGQCVEHRMDRKYSRRIVAVFALPGVAYPGIEMSARRPLDLPLTVQPASTVSQAQRMRIA